MTISVQQIAAVEDATLPFEVSLRCPRCGTAMSSLVCRSCALELQVRNGIVDALPPERAVYYEKFVQDYERIRAAEGRGSQNDNFYLGLPYQDISDKNSQQWKIRARSFDYLMERLRNDSVIGASGKILDIGAGNCWMSYRLALAGYRPFAVDLLRNDWDGLGTAQHYRQRVPELFPRFRAEMSKLPFQDEQFDAVIFNASFHYAENYETVLSEALRCVKAGGILVICDSAWYPNDESGQRMLEERRQAFLARYGTPSDSIRSLEYLTDSRLKALEQKLSICWKVHSPQYGFRWAMRPLVAGLRGRHKPSQFRIYIARRDK